MVDADEKSSMQAVSAEAMTLDVAYQSLEMVRKVNLQVEFEKEVEEDHCVPCLRAEHSSNVVKSRFGKWMSKKAAAPCLTCGSPVCSQHRSSDFGKQSISICSDCAHLFSVNFLVHNVMHEQDPVEKKKRLNNMLEVYDRALLVLLYSTQFIDDVVTALRGNTSRHNKIGLGSSATGVVAGSLGVAGTWSGKRKCCSKALCMQHVPSPHSFCSFFHSGMYHLHSRGTASFAGVNFVRWWCYGRKRRKRSRQLSMRTKQDGRSYFDVTLDHF